jgi:RluA family pseudouridine synthase
MKLSYYLKEKHPDFSNKEIKRSLENGACTINGKIETFASREINPAKDKIIFNTKKFKAAEKLEIKKQNIKFEDDDLLIYDKEAGHACMATEGKKVNLHEELKKKLKLKYLEPAHRLDKDTSGLIIFCKKPKALKVMMQAFKDKTIQKTYLAIVDGKWSKSDSGTIKNYLELDFKKRGMQKWKVSKVKPEIAEKNKQKYKYAETQYQLRSATKSHSLLELKPKTGRTHQLRIHLSHLGFPILGDNLYAENFKNKGLFTRHLLHAFELKFNHPINNQRYTVSAKAPADFEISS